MEARVNAQEKLADNLEEAALFLSDPNNSLQDFIAMNKAKAKRAKKEASTQQTGATQQVGRFKVRVK
mgnify:FL=1